MSKGGERPGSGRKKLPEEEKRVNFNVRVKPETRQKIESEAKLWGKSMGQVVDGWAEKAQ